MMKSDSDEKQDLSPKNSFLKKRTNYVRRKSSRKQAKGQSISQKFDDPDCYESIIDIFKELEIGLRRANILLLIRMNPIALPLIIDQ